MFLFDLHQETMLIGLVQGMPDLKLENLLCGGVVFLRMGQEKRKKGIQQLLVICTCRH